MSIEACLIGFAIGDAFGAGVEFQDRDWIRAKVDFSRFVNARDHIKVEKNKLKWFTENYQDWDYTDDTEMTIGMIKALMSEEVFTESLLIDCWESEYRQGFETKGFGRNGHGSMRWYYSGEQSIEAIRAFQRNRPNPGNAAAMRALPLAFLPNSLIHPFAQINARATHPHKHAEFSSQCIARAGEYLMLKNGDQQKVIEYCLDMLELDSTFLNYLQAVDRLKSYEKFSDHDFEILAGPQVIEVPYFLPGIKGVPSDALYTTGAMLYILKQASDPFDALKKAVYLGGDVDSLASTCTGMMAYRMGLESIPDFMLENIEGRSYLKTIAKRFEQWIKSEPYSQENTMSSFKS